MSRVLLSTTGVPTTVTINDLGAILFTHPVVDFELIAPLGQFDMETVNTSINSGDLGAAEAAGEITLTDEFGNTISSGDAVQNFVSLTNDEDIDAVKTFTQDVPLIISAPSAGSGNLEIGWFDYTTSDCYGIRRNDASGFFCLMPNADNPQIILGNENNTTGSGFIDVDNNRPLNLNVLDTGAGSPAVVNIGTGGLNINAGGNITLGASNTVDGVDVGSPKNSIEVNTNQYQLVGDLTSPGANQVYGTDGAGVKGWKADPASTSDGPLACVQARRTTTYTLTTTFTDITLDSTDVENDTNTVEHDNTNTDRILIKTTGLYLITYAFDINQPQTTTTTIEAQARVRVNDTTVLNGSDKETTTFQDGSIGGNNFTNSLANSFYYSATAGDFVSLQLAKVDVAGTPTATTRANLIFTVTSMSGVQGPAGPAGSGDISGPGSSTDNAIVRWDGTAGDTIQNSFWTIADDGFLSPGTSISRTGYVAEFVNTLATGGGNGLLVCAGEVNGDISLSIKDQDATLTMLEVSANFEGNVVSATLADTITANGVAYGWDLQGSGNNADFNTQNGNYRKAGAIIPIQQTRFTAMDLSFPNTSDWAVNGFASISSGTSNSALRVRRFDDTTVEGVGFILDVPPGASNIVIRLTHRRQSGTAAANVVIDLWRRLIPNNAAIGSWVNATVGTIAMNTNTNWAQTTFNVPISTFTLTAGSIYQFELTRDAGDAADTLSGDWTLLYLEVDFT